MSIEAGTRVRLLVKFGDSEPGTLGKVLSDEDFDGEVGEYRYPDEISILWDGVEDDWAYVTPDELDVTFEVVT